MSLLVVLPQAIEDVSIFRDIPVIDLFIETGEQIGFQSPQSLPGLSG